jgi:hypothetical protein
MKLALSPRGMGAHLAPAKARKVALVHGMFAGGSCWFEVIARLAEGKTIATRGNDDRENPGGTQTHAEGAKS